MEKRPVQCTVHPPISVFAAAAAHSSLPPNRASRRPDTPSSPTPGLVILDVSFPNALHSDIDEIHFTNSYTASVSVFSRPRRQGEPSRPPGSAAAEWSRCVARRTLMPDPHCEGGAEGRYVLRPEGAAPLRNVSELRFVLRQPAPCWRQFDIHDIKIYRYASRQSSEDDQLSAWLSEVSGEGWGDERSEVMGAEGEGEGLAGVRSLPQLSAAMQRLWALTLCATDARRASAAIRRYDVDGCYDINLLSTSKSAQ